jgi:hypothetical protein
MGYVFKVGDMVRMPDVAPPGWVPEMGYLLGTTIIVERLLGGIIKIPRTNNGFSWNVNTKHVTLVEDSVAPVNAFPESGCYKGKDALDVYLKYLKPNGALNTAQGALEDNITGYAFNWNTTSKGLVAHSGVDNYKRYTKPQIAKEFPVKSEETTPQDHKTWNGVVTGGVYVGDDAEEIYFKYTFPGPIDPVLSNQIRIQSAFSWKDGVVSPGNNYALPVVGERDISSAFTMRRFTDASAPSRGTCKTQTIQGAVQDNSYKSYATPKENAAKVIGGMYLSSQEKALLDNFTHPHEEVPQHPMYANLTERNLTDALLSMHGGGVDESTVKSLVKKKVKRTLDMVSKVDQIVNIK